MADEYVIPKLDEIRIRFKNIIQKLIPEASLSVGSDYDQQSRVLSVVLLPLFGHIKFALQQIFPNTASAQYLAQHGIKRGIARKDAAKSSGFALYRGSNLTVQPANAILSDPSGVQLKTTSAQVVSLAVWANKTVVAYDPLVPNTVVVSNVTGMSVGDIFGINTDYYAIKDLPGSGALVIHGRFKTAPVPTVDQLYPEAGALLPIEALTAGAIGNLEYGTIIEFASPVENPTCEVQELGGGADQQSLPEWARVMQDFDAERIGANNRAQALLLMLEQPGVAEGFVYSEFRGPGTADLVPQGVRFARHLGIVRIGEIQTAIAPLPPTDGNPGYVAIGGHDWLFTDFMDQFVPVDIRLTGGPGYGPDWLGTLTADVGCTTLRINTTIDPRGSVAVKSRVVIQSGPPTFLEQREVISVDATGFNVAPAFTVVPVAGATIWPGSSLIEGVRDNILDMFANLGPGDTSPPTRYPAPTTRAPAELTVNLVHSVVKAVTGVSNAAIISPPSDISPAPKTQCALLSLVLRYA
jgi:uncharacterized phage protein gp47/JayE